MRFLDRHPDVERCKHGEDKSLQVSHQTLKQRDKDAEEDAHHRYSAAHKGTKEIAKDEDKEDESEDDDMAGGHIGEETDHQYDGLGKDTHQFHQRHQRENLQPRGNTGSVEDIGPVVAVTADIGNEKGDDSQSSSDSDIAANVTTCREDRYQTQDIAEEDKEEEGEQIRQIFLVFGFTNHRTNNIVPHKDHQHLHEALQVLGCLVGTLLVAFLRHHHNDY